VFSSSLISEFSSPLNILLLKFSVYLILIDLNSPLKKLLLTLTVLNPFPKKITYILNLTFNFRGETKMMGYIFLAYGGLLVVMGVAFAITYKKLAIGIEDEETAS
jgi:hypothetical protein